MDKYNCVKNNKKGVRPPPLHVLAGIKKLFTA